MKTAVSIPDPVFQAAESLAKRLGISRSQLFAQALEAYVEVHKLDKVREALDKVYTQESSLVDHALAEIQSASLAQEEW